jgi:hypothetical protein
MLFTEHRSRCEPHLDGVWRCVEVNGELGQGEGLLTGVFTVRGSQRIVAHRTRCLSDTFRTPEALGAGHSGLFLDMRIHDAAVDGQLLTGPWFGIPFSLYRMALCLPSLSGGGIAAIELNKHSFAASLVSIASMTSAISAPSQSLPSSITLSASCSVRCCVLPRTGRSSVRGALSNWPSRDPAPRVWGILCTK